VTKKQKQIKRIFDVFLSILLIVILLMPIIILLILSSIDTKSLGLFVQDRVGEKARIFKIFKLKTINSDGECSKFGHLLRRYKFDELPQLFNVLIADMSFVGPRPDTIGFADALIGNDRLILTVKPGITGPASLKFYNEEQILKNKKDPEKFNRQIIWPEKVAINIHYIENYCIFKDLKFIIKTIINVF